MHKIKLKRHADKRANRGHLWIFSNEIENFDPSIPAGDEVLVYDNGGRLVGTGLFNPNSLISVRLHSREKVQPFDGDFIRARLTGALKRRVELFGEDCTSYRAVFAEGDGLPGLIVDRFGDVLSAQILTAGLEKRVDLVTGLLDELLKPSAIVLKNDTKARELEGLKQGVTVVKGALPPDGVWFTLNGLSFMADIAEGQKTGFFFDQRENYKLMQNLCKGAKVLDSFCYSGAWGNHALKWVAGEVTFLDVSAPALELAKRNAVRNNFNNFNLVCADTLDYLKSSQDAFDVVVLDPPAYAKSRKAADQAIKGYINLNAMAARDSGRWVRAIGMGTQAPDHPWVPGMPETLYLKAMLLEVD